MNPLALLDSILGDWASPRVRRLIHSLILLVVAVVTAYYASDGDWAKAGISLVAALYAAANKANTLSTTLTPAGLDTAPDDDLSYEQAGGADYPEAAEDAASGTPETTPLYESGEPPAYVVTDAHDATGAPVSGNGTLPGPSSPTWLG